MTKRSLGALIVLNLVLLAGLLVVTQTEPAQAQFGGGNNYLMIAGEVQGRNSQNAVYIIETQSARAVALFFNGSTNTVEYMAARDVGQDTAGGGGRTR